MTVGEKIRTIRKGLKLSATVFGEPLGIKKSHLSAIENDKSHPSDAVVRLLLQHYNVSNDWWEREEGGMFAKQTLAEKEKAELAPEDQENLSLIMKLGPRKKRELRAELYRLLAEQEREALKGE